MSDGKRGERKSHPHEKQHVITESAAMLALRASISTLREPRYDEIAATPSDAPYAAVSEALTTPDKSVVGLAKWAEALSHRGQVLIIGTLLSKLPDDSVQTVLDHCKRLLAKKADELPTGVPTL